MRRPQAGMWVFRGGRVVVVLRVGLIVSLGWPSPTQSDLIWLTRGVTAEDYVVCARVLPGFQHVSPLMTTRFRV